MVKSGWELTMGKFLLNGEWPRIVAAWDSGHGISVDAMATGIDGQ